MGHGPVVKPEAEANPFKARPSEIFLRESLCCGITGGTVSNVSTNASLQGSGGALWRSGYTDGVSLRRHLSSVRDE